MDADEGTQSSVVLDKGVSNGTDDASDSFAPFLFQPVLEEENVGLALVVGLVAHAVISCHCYDGPETGEVAKSLVDGLHEVIRLLGPRRMVMLHEVGKGQVEEVGALFLEDLDPRIQDVQRQVAGVL